MIRINVRDLKVAQAACQCSPAEDLVVTEKTGIIDLLGETALAVPTLLATAQEANERAKFVLSLFQMAAHRADNPELPADTLRRDRETCGIADASLDHIVGDSESDGRGSYVIPGSRRLISLLTQNLQAMLAPLELAARGGNAEQVADYREYAGRLERLQSGLPPMAEDVVSRETIARLTSGRPASGDGFHVLVMDLHKEINRLQAAIATETIDGAKVYEIKSEFQRQLIRAFMAGVAETAPLKFDHPGLGTTAACVGDALVIQNDIGTTDAHVLIVRVTGNALEVTYSDVHVQRLEFFESLLGDLGVAWEDMRSRRALGLHDSNVFYLASGCYEAKDDADLGAILGRLGSRLVFLIDWNRARKRLGGLVKNQEAVGVLKWAADNNVGHRGFLKLGGERLIYEAIEQAVKTPLRYGEPLTEMLGGEVARDYLRFVLEITAKGLLAGRSEALIRDQIRAELFSHFRSAEERLLTESSHHASLVYKIAVGLRDGLRQARSSGSPGALAANATCAKELESRADEIVRETRAMVRRVSGTTAFLRLLEVADDAADQLEDAAWLAGLLASAEAPLDLPPALDGMAELAADAANALRRATETAQYIHRGGTRESVQSFLEAVDRLATVEHRTDEKEREVIAALIASDRGHREFYLISGIAHHLESATDSLLRAGFVLRDHVLGEVMFV